MPSMCCVPGCRGNYEAESRVSVFSFPKHEVLKKKWKSAIKRDMEISRHTRVCHLHFRECDLVKFCSAVDPATGKKIAAPLSKIRLAEGAIPSVFLDLPISSNSRKLRGVKKRHKRKKNNTKDRRKKQRREEEQIESDADIDASAFHHEQEDGPLLEAGKIESFSSLQLKLHEIVDDNHWNFIDSTPDSVNICHVTDCDVRVQHCVSVDRNLLLSVFIEGVRMEEVDTSVFPSTIGTVDDMRALLSFVSGIDSSKQQSTDFVTIIQLVVTLLRSLLSSGCKHEGVIEFVCEQLLLITQSPLEYSTDFTVFSSLLYYLSPCAYKFVRNSRSIILPCYSIIQSINMSFITEQMKERSGSLLSYIKQKIVSLQPEDKLVSLIVDEISLKPFSDYERGGIVGRYFDGSTVATSAYVFMISSVLSAYKDVVHILPVRKIKGEVLFHFVRQVITGLDNLGVKVICVVSDNRSVNCSAMSMFADPPRMSIVYQHPVSSDRPLFFMFDSVHILKCIRNNWLNRKGPLKSFVFPHFSDFSKSLSASFSTVEKLYTLETGSLLKSSYGSSLEAIHPSTVERENVKLVLSVMSDHVVQALRSSGVTSKLDFPEDTAHFIKIFMRWWTIFNVKTPYEGPRFRNVYDHPLTGSTTDASHLLLEHFMKWLDRWMTDGNMVGLTRETFLIVHHTTHALYEMTKYCFEELGLPFILPGKFQMDCLEERFGQCMGLPG